METMCTEAYAARIKDRTRLNESSSGGAFTVLSDLFLNNGNAVACAVYDYEIQLPHFQLITDIEKRDQALGSKYVQSELGDIYQQAGQWLFTNPEKKLLFIGMGCQAEGFRRYCEKKGFRSRTVIVDIICHGAPAPQLWKDYIRELEKKHNGTVCFVTFKDKRNGWKNPTAFAKIGDEEVSIAPYVQAFNMGLSLRPSCYVCPYCTTERKTDLTIGDFWGIEKTIPEFYDPMGNQLILVHSEVGRVMFHQIEPFMEYRACEISQCLQENLEHPTQKPQQREAFWKAYESKGATYAIKRFTVPSLPRRVVRKMKKTMKAFCNAFCNRIFHT